MKCIYCGAEWKVGQNTSFQVTVCPFCKKPLTQENSTVESALRWIIKERGTEVFGNADLMNALLADLAYDDEKNRQKIRLALSAGAGKLFLRMAKKDNGILSDSDAKEFQASLEEYGFTHEFADFVFRTFKEAMPLEKGKKAERIKERSEKEGAQAEVFRSAKYDVWLNDAGTNKLLTVTFLKAELGVGLTKAQNIIASAPVIIRKDVSYAQAKKLERIFGEIGVRLTIKPAV